MRRITDLSDDHVEGDSFLFLLPFTDRIVIDDGRANDKINGDLRWLKRLHYKDFIDTKAVFLLEIVFPGDNSVVFHMRDTKSFITEAILFR